MLTPSIPVVGNTNAVSPDETDNVTAIELERNRRILYFSDGTMEELTDSENELDVDVTDRSLDISLNEKEMPIVPRLKYKAFKVGNNILAGIDYIGGGLASFLGITTPKYSSEMEHYKRNVSAADEVDRELEDVNCDTWQRTDKNKNDQVITKDPNFI